MIESISSPAGRDASAFFTTAPMGPGHCDLVSDLLQAGLEIKFQNAKI
jgi:hypothetical protein